MECICYKTNLKATLFFETAIKQGNRATKNQIYHLHIKNTQVLLKMQNLKKRMKQPIMILTALNDEDKLKKINVAGINLSWMNTKRSRCH
jgi:hypothetical protein